VSGSIRLAAAVLACVAAIGASVPVVSAAPAKVGIVPPSKPRSNCPLAPGASPLSAIDRCRARERVGPMRLPSNWARLSPVERTFVAINLERVNRGLKPVAGLTRSVDAVAQRGAQARADPSFPNTPGLLAAGSIWWSTGSPLTAILYWMYEDGPGGGNESCPPQGGGLCWGHRDVILLGGSELLGGGGHNASNTTFEILSVSPSSAGHAAFVFSWSRELRFFASRPGPEPKRG
jgi:hypothetical protein